MSRPHRRRGGAPTLYTHRPDTASVVRVSADGRRVIDHPVTVDRGAPALPAYFAEDVSTNAGLDAPEFSYDMGDESLAPEVQEPEADGISVTVKPKRYVNSVRCCLY